jgi:hypothetical protein
VVRTVVGYHRYDTPAELRLLNEIWTLQSLMTNYFYAQQKLISKVRDGAKAIKKYDRATTPHRHGAAHAGVTAEDKIILADTYAALNPAAVQREIQNLTGQLLKPPPRAARVRSRPFGPHTRAHRLMSQRNRLRARSFESGQARSAIILDTVGDAPVCRLVLCLPRVDRHTSYAAMEHRHTRPEPSTPRARSTHATTNLCQTGPVRLPVKLRP